MLQYYILRKMTISSPFENIIWVNFLFFMQFFIGLKVLSLLNLKRFSKFNPSVQKLCDRDVMLWDYCSTTFTKEVCTIFFSFFLNFIHVFMVKLCKIACRDIFCSHRALLFCQSIPNVYAYQHRNILNVNWIEQQVLIKWQRKLF